MNEAGNKAFAEWANSLPSGEPLGLATIHAAFSAGYEAGNQKLLQACGAAWRYFENPGNGTPRTADEVLKLLQDAIDDAKG